MAEISGAAALLAEVERREAELARLDEEFRTARVTARSEDRTVAVTVDVRGHVVEVELAPGTPRAHPPERLGPLIAELATRAAGTLREHYERRAALTRVPR
ncbi:YbaB/EbfC family nucleoid-associated protein [Tsukamurella asaccharolytica]|uniref:YbaB/EbfC family nucleoid-associated protein n=1 Tax=Tsukamurella asaccharolytica TaxID=2592067 RepID=A0A5C5RGV6_9ACTN|nr:YbaB/EbfC family nucleoid-associated protein [Tsukamurella asaccharolytica]TWS21411.1 YbaB/EbfC family nucleoid-associated protein [Tsukamurella asaccharolytica]